MIAPFPWFGGKSMAAPEVWRRFGPVDNYVEPFCGSAAVLLARPDDHAWWRHTETVNDSDGYVSNFWRAVAVDSDAVAAAADWPVNENDLHARHAALVTARESLTARLEGDPGYYDARLAGWWCWGHCCWIGSGFASGNGPWRVIDGELVDVRKLPHLGDAGQGVNRKLPHLGNAGQGVNRQLPHLGNAGQGHADAWSRHIRDTMQALSDRLRRVRVCSGDWSRVVTDSVTVRHGVTGVFLDPPYALEGRATGLYTHDTDVSRNVREWAVANGDDPMLRIALCGYEGDYEMPDTWTAHRWKARGGYGSQGNGTRGAANAARETIWFSPHCLNPAAELPLFAGLAEVS